MGTCNKCNREYNRAECDYCLRAGRWEAQQLPKIMMSFTPRVQEELKELDIQIPDQQVQEVRKGKCLYITGIVGSGKTLYASQFMINSMRLAFIEHSLPRTHVFITVPDLLDHLRNWYKDDTLADPMEIASTEFLVLDDLGLEKLTDWVHEKLYQIINYRYEYRLPTIITSNLSIGEISERMGDDRIASRINQMSEVQKLNDIDYRLH